MTITRRSAGSALTLLLLLPGFAPAAWDNVFQLTCCNRPRTSMRISAAPPCCPAPAPVCCPQTAFVQRSFFQPVTAFRPVVSWEPVTTQQTSFFWEPVQTCTTSLFVDPCTGCTQQVSTPTTSFQLRQQCNPVTNWVQRVSYQPVQAFRQSFFMEPVTVNSCSPTPVVAAPAPVLSVPPAAAAPPASSDLIVPAPSTPPPPLNTPQFQQPQTTEQLRPSTSAPLSRPVPAPFRPDQVASRGSSISGTVVRTDYKPQPNARVRFVSAKGQEVVTADATGRFNVTLPAGQWKIYTDDAAGRAAFHSDFVVRDGNRNVMLVSR
jgi:hypothetical protein